MTKYDERQRGETATLGGGCFWCLEAVFREVPGVLSVTPGYAGGHVPHPTYSEVCTGRTGHAEVVQLQFDPDQVTYRRLLEIFFSVHDPTTVNRQGDDVGTQYRSIILHHDAAQLATAQEMIGFLEETVFGRGRIVTELVPFREFYAAEPEHVDYYRRNPDASYCRLVIAPKVRKLRLLLEDASPRKPAAGIHGGKS